MKIHNFNEAELEQLRQNGILIDIINILPENIYWKNADGVYTGCNETQANVLGFDSPQDMIGKTDYELSRASEADLLRQNDMRIMSNQRAESTEEAVTVNHEQKYYLSHKIPLKNEAQKIVGIMGISIDITERKKIQELEKELAVTQERLKVAQLMSASVAHEVRTPLASLAMELEDVKNYAQKEDKSLIPTVDNIEGALESAHHIIEMLLLKSKTNKLNITDQTSLSLKSIIHDGINEYPFKRGQRERLTIDTTSDFHFVGNTFYFKHILFNLLKNSFYAIQKAQKGTVSISINAKNRTLIFEDTACGIPDDILPHIFDSFYTQSERGTGVGLALCKQIMEEFNGTFECATELGSFTRLTLSFPALKN